MNFLQNYEVFGETKMKDTKPVVTMNQQFQYRDNTKKALIGISGAVSILMKRRKTTMIASIEILINEPKSVVMGEVKMRKSFNIEKNYS